MNDCERARKPEDGGPGGRAGRRQLLDGDGEEQVDPCRQSQQEDHPARTQVLMLVSARGPCGKVICIFIVLVPSLLYR